MRADIIQADYDQLDAIAAKFGSEAEQIMQMERDVQRSVENLRQGGWEGAAANGFFSEMDGDVLPALVRLGQALQLAHDMTLQIKAIFRQAEQEAAALFRINPARVQAGTKGNAPLIQGSGHGLFAPLRDEPVVIENVKQTELNVFFSQYEDSAIFGIPVMSSALKKKYLTDPQLMEVQHEVIRTLAERAQTGEKPLTSEEFYELVLEQTDDPGTALILAHNITKALARGGSAIGWEKISDDPITYAIDGQRFVFDPVDFHAEATLSARGKPSVFYAMFSGDTFGTDDPGDWYHFYLQAAASYTKLR